jgi:hypothetical protein
VAQQSYDLLPKIRARDDTTFGIMQVARGHKQLMGTAVSETMSRVLSRTK